MSEAALAIYLDAPFQSWGVSSRFQHRQSEAFPTKSAVIGIIAAALGVDKNSGSEGDDIAPLGELRMSVYRLRADGRPMQRLVDFHTVGGGYDTSDPMQKLSIPRKASGGPSGNAVITHRTYLNDARFVVVLEGDEKILENCRDALINPVWGVWFGRKSCIPASPLCPLISSRKDKALEELLDYLNRRRSSEDALRVEAGLEEYPQTEDLQGVWYPRDQPLSFQSRKYSGRPVRRIRESDYGSLRTPAT